MSKMVGHPVQRIVMDTNVLYAALRSRDGASFQILDSIWNNQTTLLLSHTVLTEYEEILKREAVAISMTIQEIDEFLDALCTDAELVLIDDFSPLPSNNPDDEPFVRLAMASRDCFLVTHNLRHYSAFADFPGIKLLAPKDFLSIIRS
jgi:putative PIN family toxin of toxin-antitoxin system